MDGTVGRALLGAMIGGAILLVVWQIATLDATERAARTSTWSAPSGVVVVFPTEMGFRLLGGNLDTPVPTPEPTATVARTPAPKPTPVRPCPVEPGGVCAWAEDVVVATAMPDCLTPVVGQTCLMPMPRATEAPAGMLVP